jgi:hypothetical protein
MIARALRATCCANCSGTSIVTPFLYDGRSCGARIQNTACNWSQTFSRRMLPYSNVAADAVSVTTRFALQQEIFRFEREAARETKEHGGQTESAGSLEGRCCRLYRPEVILRCDAIDSRTQEFELDIPECDWRQIVSDYDHGSCCLGDARAFVTAWHEVLQVLKTAKRDGSYCSPAWIAGREA